MADVTYREANIRTLIAAVDKGALVAREVSYEFSNGRRFTEPRTAEYPATTPETDTPEEYTVGVP